MAPSFFFLSSAHLWQACGGPCVFLRQNDDVYKQLGPPRQREQSKLSVAMCTATARNRVCMCSGPLEFFPLALSPWPCPLCPEDRTPEVAATTPHWIGAGVRCNRLLWSRPPARQGSAFHFCLCPPPFLPIALLSPLSSLLIL